MIVTIILAKADSFDFFINTLNNVYRVGCKYRLPYINFWNLYNNEPDNDFGLIDKDGQFTLSGKLFNSLRR